jgi:hypothetical protein
MKKAILTFGLFSLVMILTSFTTPETSTINRAADGGTGGTVRLDRAADGGTGGTVRLDRAADGGTGGTVRLD